MRRRILYAVSALVDILLALKNEILALHLPCSHEQSYHNSPADR
jgi:hypothetical protein